MRVLVTGASGFIGSHLSRRLEEEGHDVTRLIRYASGGRYDFYDQKKVIMADLADCHGLQDSIRSAKPEVIFHLGAISAVSYSFTHPEEVGEVVYMGTARVAEVAREIGAWMLHASSSEVYGREKEYTWPVKEDTALGGTSPYGAAKVGAEEYLRMCMAVYGQPITIMRPFNSLGRAFMRNRHYVVERAITQAIEDGHISLHNSLPYRDFLFRDDHVAGYLGALKHREAAVGETFNLCTGDTWTIRRMAEHVADTVGAWMGRKVTVDFTNVPDRPGDIFRLHGDGSKARRLLGFAPKHTIAAALDQAVAEWIEVLRPDRDRAWREA